MSSCQYEDWSIYDQLGSLQQVRASHLVGAVFEFKDSYIFQNSDLETVSDLLHFLFRTEIYFKIVITNKHYSILG